MGLFSKKSSASKAELQAMRAELSDMKARLEASEQNRAAVETRLSALAVAVTSSAAPAPDHDLAERVEAIAARLDVGLAGVDPMLVARVDALTAKIAANSTIEPIVAARVDELASRLSIIDGLGAQVAQVAERLASIDAAGRVSAEQIASLEQRVTSVSTELANQLNELGNDIDGLAAHQNQQPAAAPASAIDEEVLADLRVAQVRLAAEQARYEIAFRQDLAVLAEQVRRAAGPNR